MATKQTAKRGRPAFSPSEEQRRIVSEMKFCGETNSTIARALSIDVGTLSKHFADELEDGHAHRRREVIGLLFASARKGNVAATKRLEEMGRIAGAAEAARDRGTKQERLGKKEQRQANAEAASSAGKFAVPQPPRLVVAN